MAINYRVDPDLAFLSSCSDEDLDVLVRYLTNDKDGKQRITQELLEDAAFISCGSNYNRAWMSIAGEIQLFGGDSVGNKLRGEGVLYKEILCDVCKKLGVNYNKNRSAVEIEENLLMKIMAESFEKLPDSEKVQLLRDMKVDNNLVGAAAVAALIQAIKMSSILSLQTAAGIAASMSKNFFGRLALQILPGALVKRSVIYNSMLRGLGAFTGPVGLALTALLIAPSITGPAYRVTIPCVIQIAYMRRKQQILSAEGDVLLLSNDFLIEKEPQT